jgi:hypothetical protein
MSAVRSFEAVRGGFSGKRRLALETLEVRTLMSASRPLADMTSLPSGSVIDDVVVTAPINNGLSVPVYNSLPGAPRTVYLDFNGNSETLYPYPGAQHVNGTIDATNKPFDVDGDLTSFNTNELAAIREVWQRVSEDYAPFNVNVTTESAQYHDHGGVRVAIGGEWNDFNWPGKRDSWGVKISFDWGPLYPGNHDPDTVWVFSETIWNDIASTPGDIGRHVADTASHEAGHHFGLGHQMLFDNEGDVIAEYAPGLPHKAPIMGDSFEPMRSTWWVGDTFGGIPPIFGEPTDPIIPTETDPWWVVEQDDMSKLAHRLGWRADDHTADLSSATPLAVVASGLPAGVSRQFTGQGIIGKIADADAFAFTINELSQLSARLDVAAVGPNLSATLQLWSVEYAVSSDGVATTLSRLIAEHNPDAIAHGIGMAQRSTDLGAQVTAMLEPGRYVLVARGDGMMGDAGQYSLLANATAAAPIQLTGGTLTLYGSNYDDVATVGMETGGVLAAQLSRYDKLGKRIGYRESRFAATAVTDILFKGYDGNDRFTNVTPLPSTAYGGDGNDTLTGGNAADALFGGLGDDTLRGLGGDDLLGGDAGNDSIYGGFGDDTIWGGDGADTLLGEFGADTIFGGAGNDYLLGGAGADSLNGDAGNDYLDGGYDGLADTLRGGPGSDTFIRHRTATVTRRGTTYTYDPDVLADFNGLWDTLVNIDHV